MRALAQLSRWRLDTEIWWYLSVVGLALLLTVLPTVLAYSHRDAGWGYVGMLRSPDDAAQFFGAMREGASSTSWLIQDRLTTEPHSSILMYAFYVGLGKLTWLLGVDPRVMYHLAELVARATLIMAVALLARVTLPTPTQRRVAVVLVLVGTGPYLIAILLGRLVGSTMGVWAPENVWLPELSGATLMYMAPHLVLSAAFVLLAGLSYLLAWSGRTVLGAILAAISTAVVGLTNVFMVVPLGALPVVYLGLMWWRDRRAPKGALGAAAAMMLVAGGFLLYNVAVFRADPFWNRTYGGQSGMGTPDPLQLALLLGGVAVLAVPGLRMLLRPGTPAQWMLVAWLVTNAMLMYVPVGIERRFTLGLQPMLTVAAAPAVVAIFGWFRCARYPGRGVIRPLLMSLLALTLVGSTLPVQITLLKVASDPTATAVSLATTTEAATAMLTETSAGPFYPVELDGAVTWLAQHTGPDDRLVAAPWTANVLASRAPGRFYVAHGVATFDYGTKAREVFAALRSPSSADLPAFMRSRQLNYVIVGPYERALGIGSAPDDRLRQVYSRDGVDVFELAEPNVAEKGGGSR